MMKPINGRRWSSGLLLASTAVVSAAVCHPAFAQGDAQSAAPKEAGQGLEEIIVTAERRSESVQTTAIAISAVSGEALQERQVFNIESLSNQIPGVEFGRIAGDAKVYIRGVGYDSISPGGETRVALYSDNIYQARTQSGFLAFYDVDRVEVLRGPQGTLYGRNATGGAINIITREPTDILEGYVSGRVGNYGLIGTEGAVGGPLSESVSARLAFQTVDRNGFGTNISTGEEVNDEQKRNVRLKLKFEPSANFSVRLMADYGKEHDHSGGYRYIGAARPDFTPLTLAFGGTTPTDPQDSAGFGPRLFLETYGFSAEAKLALGPSTDIVSLTGYRHLIAKNESNFDTNTLELSKQFLVDRSDMFTQELRLSHSFGDFADILLGGYYYHEKSFAKNEIGLTGGVFGAPVFPLLEFYETRGDLKTEAYALFGEVRIHPVPQLTVTLGGRYSHEKKSLVESLEFDLVNPFDPDRFNPAATVPNSQTESRFDPKITIDYEVNDDVFLYATFSRGFKAGGFNIGGLQDPFKPEVIKNYEAGIKADLFDRRLRANLAVFHYDYSNLQVNVVEGVALVTRNAAKAKVDGVELEMTALPVDGLRLAANVTYLDARYSDFESIDNLYPELGLQNLKGNRLNYSPEWKLNGEIGYTFETGIGNITPRFNVTWVDKIYFRQFNLDVMSQASRTNVDAFLGYESPDGLWSASAYVTNLTDDTYVAGATVSAGVVGFPILGQYGPPRTYGLSVTRRF